jgi:hypothetical protein
MDIQKHKIGKRENGLLAVELADLNRKLAQLDTKDGDGFVLFWNNPVQNAKLLKRRDWIETSLRRGWYRKCDLDDYTV